MYHTLENKIIPAYYNQDQNGISRQWITLMKNSIKTTGGKYSTSRMVIDYVNDLYMPLCNMKNKYFENIEKVVEFSNWKNNMNANWEKITITQDENVDNKKLVAGSKIKVRCIVEFKDINKDDASVQVYLGKFMENGTVKNVYKEEMKFISEENGKCIYEASLKLENGGNFGYTFRALPKNEMLTEPENMNLIKWIEK